SWKPEHRTASCKEVILIPPHPASPSAPPASPTEGRGVIFFPLPSAFGWSRCHPCASRDPEKTLSPLRERVAWPSGQAG
ncbi:MAG: hypothetical protein NZ602_16100, partial [Thermoguttaceae bacterium]|nr:hypothetical protein [Thermoguttaceae bacterium]